MLILVVFFFSHKMFASLKGPVILLLENYSKIQQIFPGIPGTSTFPHSLVAAQQPQDYSPEFSAVRSVTV